MSVFIPSNGIEAPEDITIENDGFFPAISLNAFKSDMGVGDVFMPDRLAHLLTLSLLEINASLSSWRETVTEYQSLADIPATQYGGISEKILHYQNAIFNRAKALFIERTRDYDSTKSGHERADELTEAADDHMRQSSESIARLMDQSRTNVELI